MSRAPGAGAGGHPCRNAHCLRQILTTVVHTDIVHMHLITVLKKFHTKFPGDSQEIAEATSRSLKKKCVSAKLYISSSMRKPNRTDVALSWRQQNHCEKSLQNRSNFDAISILPFQIWQHTLQRGDCGRQHRLHPFPK